MRSSKEFPVMEKCTKAFSEFSENLDFSLLNNQDAAIKPLTFITLNC
jgi:hypothetical protein